MPETERKRRISITVSWEDSSAFGELKVDVTAIVSDGDT